MMRKSCIRLEQAKFFGLIHNAREVCPSYLIDDPSRNFCNRGAINAFLRYIKMLRKASNEYYERTGQSLQVDMSNTLWEAVIVLEKQHTAIDIANLLKFLYRRYGWREIQTSIHRDEGHVNEFGKKVYNYHAHIIFFMLDLQTGKYLFKRNRFGKKAMSLLQTEVALLLGMQRGVSKWKTGRKHIPPTNYRKKMKEKQMKREESKKVSYSTVIQVISSVQKQNFELEKKVLELSGRVQYLESLVNKEQSGNDGNVIKPVL